MKEYELVITMPVGPLALAHCLWFFHGKGLSCGFPGLFQCFLVRLARSYDLDGFLFPGDGFRFFLFFGFLFLGGHTIKIKKTAEFCKTAVRSLLFLCNF